MSHTPLVRDLTAPAVIPHSSASPTPDAHVDHVVQFYESEDFLYDVVAGHLAQGLNAGRPVVTIATAEHSRGFFEKLAHRGFDVEGLRARGRIVAADAQETLASFMVDSTPDASLFETQVGGLVERVLRTTGSASLHAYGEMVDVLCRSGNAAAAMRLEDLWNELGRRYSFALLCAYSMGNFESEAHATLFADTCRRHGQVTPAESYEATADVDARRRQIAELQQRARALETEIGQRRALEVLLRKAISAQRETEEALKESQRELQADLAGIGRLHQMSLRLTGTLDLRLVLDDVLATAAALSDADMGLVSLCGDGDHLDLGASLGFPAEVIEKVRRIPAGSGACGVAFAERRRVIVEDVEADPLFTPYLAVARHAGFRAVHSTPLVTNHERVIGVLSVHFRVPRRPTAHEIRLLDLCARQAADFIENVRMYERLRENDRRKDELLAMLAHELRNPLAPMQNAIEILRAPDGACRLEYATDVFARQVRQMSRLVDDLLDLSRITTGRLELRKARVAISDVLTAALETSRPLIDGCALQLSVTMPPANVYVEGDLVRLVQVVSNLLNNASKYTDRGGRAALSTEIHENEIRITVADTGIGIPSDKLDTVFEMFAQLGDADHRSRGGLGIGLALAKRLVELHGGRITAASLGIGKGSTFTVHLPRAGARTSDQRSEPKRTSSVATVKVLVVDDNIDSADTMGMLLELKGATTRLAYDGEAALAAAAEFRPDAILLDIGLPGIDGHEVARRLRAESHGRGVLLVAMSGWGQDGDRHASLDAGFDRHVTKPVDHAVLDDLLSNLASHRRQRAESQQAGE